MDLMSRKSNAKLLDARRRAIFGRAIRPAMQDQEPAGVPAGERAAELAVVVTAAAGDGVEGSRRKARRVTVADEVGIRRIGGFNFLSRLNDVSATGCRVELIEKYETGDHIIARFPKLEPLGAKVCWSAGTTAGIEFLSGMHPAVFDSLLMRLGAPEKRGRATPLA
jgi:hypothetical protein